MLVFKFPVAVKLLVLLIEAGEALTVEQDAVVFCSACELVVVNARDDVVEDVVEMDAVVEVEAFVLLAADVVAAVAKPCEFPVVVSIFYFIFKLFF